MAPVTRSEIIDMRLIISSASMVYSNLRKKDTITINNGIKANQDRRYP